MEELTATRMGNIRAFNRFYTGFLGLLNPDFLNSPFSLSEARVIFEIGENAGCTVTGLIELLELDPGYLSRILSKLESQGLVRKQKSSADRRVSFLYLTESGGQILRDLAERSNREIYEKIKHLPITEQVYLVDRMNEIESILGRPQERSFIIREYMPGDLGYLDYMHCRLYQREYGLEGFSFEQYLLPAMTNFVTDREKERNSNAWVAEFHNQIIGSIAIVRLADDVAQLRWFLIEPQFRGQGLGNLLMPISLDFCKNSGYEKVFLWTIDILHPARHLYSKFGFRLTESKSHFLWGKNLTEERWELTF